MLYKEWRTVRFKFSLWLICYCFVGLLLLTGWLLTTRHWKDMYPTWLNCGFFLAVVSGIFGGIDVISEETDKGTLSFLLTRPLPRAHIYLTKLLINIGALSVVCLSSSFVMLMIDLLTNNQRPIKLSEALALTLLMELSGVLVTGVSGLLSVFTHNPIQTLFCSVAAIMPLALFLNLFNQGLNLNVFQYNNYNPVGGGYFDYVLKILLATLLLGGITIFMLWLGARLFEKHEF